MVEFALVLPILLLLVMGIIQFGIVFNNYVTLTDGVRAGARQAAVSRDLPDPGRWRRTASSLRPRVSTRASSSHRHAVRSRGRNRPPGSRAATSPSRRSTRSDRPLRRGRHVRQAQEQRRPSASSSFQITYAFCSGVAARPARSARREGAGPRTDPSRVRDRARPRRPRAPAGSRGRRTPSRRGSARRRPLADQGVVVRRDLVVALPAPGDPEVWRPGAAARRPGDCLEPRGVGRRVEPRRAVRVRHAEEQPRPFAVEVEAGGEVDRERDPVRELGSGAVIRRRRRRLRLRPPRGHGHRGRLEGLLRGHARPQRTDRRGGEHVALPLRDRVLGARLPAGARRRRGLYATSCSGRSRSWTCPRSPSTGSPSRRPGPSRT